MTSISKADTSLKGSQETALESFGESSPVTEEEWEIEQEQSKAEFESCVEEKIFELLSDCVKKDYESMTVNELIYLKCLSLGVFQMVTLLPCLEMNDDVLEKSCRTLKSHYKEFARRLGKQHYFENFYAKIEDEIKSLVREKNEICQRLEILCSRRVNVEASLKSFTQFPTKDKLPLENKSITVSPVKNMTKREENFTSEALISPNVKSGRNSSTGNSLFPKSDLMALPSLDTKTLCDAFSLISHDTTISTSESKLSENFIMSPAPDQEVVNLSSYGNPPPSSFGFSNAVAQKSEANNATVNSKKKRNRTNKNQPSLKTTVQEVVKVGSCINPFTLPSDTLGFENAFAQMSVANNTVVACKKKRTKKKNQTGLETTVQEVIKVGSCISPPALSSHPSEYGNAVTQMSVANNTVVAACKKKKKKKKKQPGTKAATEVMENNTTSQTPSENNSVISFKKKKSLHVKFTAILSGT